MKEDTMLILFGDHGESLTEHDIYWDHCGLYEPTVHIPLIIRWPGRIPARKRVPGFVQQVDLMPTILEAVQEHVPANLHGRSLWPAITGDVGYTHKELLFSECAWQASRGIRQGDYKLIRTYDAGPFVRPPRELYHLGDDPGETRNLALRYPDLADRMEQALNSKISAILQGRDDPMMKQLETEGLPFKRRITAILEAVGITWEQWCHNPSRQWFDQLHDAKYRK